MKIKRYVSSDFQSAIQQAKMELGSDAIILSTRRVRKKGIMGIFRSSLVEVTMGIDEELRVGLDKLRTQEDNMAAKHKSNQQVDEGNNESLILDEMNRMNNIMADIQSRIYEIESIKGISAPVKSFYNTLLENNVEEKIAKRIASTVQKRLPAGRCDDRKWISEVCMHTLQECFCNVEPIEVNRGPKPRVVVMVGPTGVGKTTTIAKLAAEFSLIRVQKVGLITLDTYRVSAAEQLRTFAEIIGVPIKVVFSPPELSTAIDEFNDKDIIFVDTAGRSPNNDEHMEELQEFMSVAQADETILVLSVSSYSSDLKNIFNKFNSVGIDKFIFTKLDETNSYGQIINIINEVKLPVAYFTNGQSVPDDIEIPEAEKFAKMVLGKDETI